MKTVIEMTDDQVNAIVVNDLKQSYMISMVYAEKDPEAAKDAEALKRVLEYYMVPSERDAFFNELDTHSKHYFDIERNR